MNENEYIVNAFTKEGEHTNLEVNQLKVDCITSKENHFELDKDGNLTVKSINTLNGISMNQNILNTIYPVGSIYMSVNNSNPQTLFGGTWEQLKDRFLLACGDTYPNGTVGGESTHTLTDAEMPAHEHNGLLVDTTQVAWSMPHAGGSINLYQSNPFSLDDSFYRTIRTAVAGGSMPHNNMPPYFTVYMWKRNA